MRHAGEDDERLAAADGSEHAARAVPVAADIAKKSNGEVVVFHAREFLLGKGGAYALEDASEAKRLVDDVVAQVAAAGAKACGRVVTAQEGRAARAILHEAEAESADAIVMGSRGHGDLVGLLLGSVAHKVMQLSHRTVVVAR